MILKGKSVYLRHPESPDAKTILIWENDPLVWTAGDNQSEYSLSDIETFIEKGQDIQRDGQERFLICLNENKESIGCIDLYDCSFKLNKAGIGILIYSDHLRNKGYGGEALTLLIDYCKDNLKLKSLFCRIHSTNEASISLFKKKSFVIKSTERKAKKVNGSWQDENYLELKLD